MSDSRPVYTLFKGTQEERPMRLTVDDKTRTVALMEHRNEDEETVVIRMTPHRARAVGERLIEMADGLVKAEK